METIYELPSWAETILIICIALMLAGLAVLISCKAIQEAIEAEAKLERKRRRKETKALNNWEALYQEERQKRLADVGELSTQIADLLKKIERKDALLAKAKVKDI